MVTTCDHFQNEVQGFLILKYFEQAKDGLVVTLLHDIDFAVQKFLLDMSLLRALVGRLIP